MKNKKIIKLCLGVLFSFIFCIPSIAQRFETNLNFDIHKVEYEGREYAVSSEGYISLIENSRPITKIIYEGRTYSRSAEGYIALVSEEYIDSKKNNEDLSIEKSPNSFVLSSIYPNPAQDILNLTFDCENSFNDNIDISIVSMEGQEFIYNIAISNNEVTSIDISNLDKGIYHIRCNNGIGVRLNRFIKQ